MCVEDLMVGYYESGEDFLADPDFIAWQERRFAANPKANLGWPAYVQALKDARELIELAPADVLALAGQKQPMAAGGDGLAVMDARMEAA